MPNAVRISTPVTAPIVASGKSDHNPLTSIALFCGIGLLVSLVAGLLGVQGAWY